MNRRKLGTSRRSKGWQRVKDLETQPDVESKEYVQDEARGNEHPETHESAAKQPKVQEEVHRVSERDMTVPQAAFLVSATTAEYSEVKTGKFCPEEHEHILESRHVNMQPFKVETKLEVIEGVNKNLHDRLPKVTSSRASASDQQIISKQAEDFNLYSVAESKSSKLVDSGLFRQDGCLQGNSSVCESHVNASITPQITADNALRENIQINKDVGQEALLLQKEELPTSKDVKLFIIPEVGDAQHSEVEENAYDQNKLTQVQVEHQNDYSAEELLHDHKDFDSYSENQKSESDYQNLFLVKSAAVKPDVLTTTEKTSLGQMDPSGGLVEDTIKHIGDSVLREGPLSEAKKNNLPEQNLSDLEAQHKESSLNTDERTADFSFSATKRKMGSSHKNKERRHLKESEEDILENTLSNESLETPTVLSDIKETGQEEVSEDTAYDISFTLTHGSSVCLVPPYDISSEFPETDSQSLTLKTENPQKDQDETNPDILVEVVENSVSQHEVDQSNILHSEYTIDSLTEDVMTLQEVDVYSTQMQESLQIQHSSETAPSEITEHLENISVNLKDQPEMSESAGEGTDSIITKQKEHQTEENISGYAQSVQLKNESKDLYDTSYLQISDLEKPYSAPSQFHEFEKGVGDDEEKPVLFDTKPKEATETVDEQSNKTFFRSSNRRKLGSSRKSRGRQDKDSKEKTCNEDTSQISLGSKIKNQEELRLDMEHDVILPVSHDSSMVSVFAPGHYLDVESSKPKFYLENDPENMVQESVNILEGQEQSGTDINIDLSYKSLEETSGRQFDTRKSKSESLPTKVIIAPYPDDMRQGQELEALQTQDPEPQQMDYTVDGQVGEGGVFVEDTKHSPSNPELQNNSLSTHEQPDAGFSRNRRHKGRQQDKESKEEILESTRNDLTLERATMFVRDELTEDNEPRITMSISNNSLFPNPPLEKYFKEQSSVPTKYPATDLQVLCVNSENLQESQNESKADTKNTVATSQQALGDLKALCSKDKRDVTEDVPMDVGRSEVHLTKLEKSLQAEHLSKTAPCNITEIVKTDDDSATKQGNYPVAIDVKNKDSGLCDTNKPQISDLEEIDPAPTEVEEFKGRVENDFRLINPHTTDQIFYQKKKGLLNELEDSKDVPTSFHSETVPFDSKSPEMTDSVDEQTTTGSDERRKMVSSESSKGRQDKKYKDVNEKSREVQIPLGTETTIQQNQDSTLLPVSNESSMFTLGHSSEMHSFFPSTYTETDIEQYENPPTDIGGNRQMNYASQTVTHDVPKYPETVLEGMIGQAEIPSNIQSELTAKRTEGSDTKQGLLPAEDQENLCFTTGGNLEALDQTNKDDHKYDSNETSISSPGGVNNTIVQMDKGMSLVEGTEYNPTDTKFQDSYLNTDVQSDAGLSFSGNRRKLGSSRRNKGRQGVKESKPEIVENTRSDETIQTPTMSLEKRRPEQKELSEGIEHAIIMSFSRDLSSMQSQILSSEDQSSASKKDSDTQQQLLIVKNELFGNKDEKMSETKIEMIDKSLNVLQQKVDHSDTIHSEDTKDAGSDDALMEEEKVELHPTKMQESLQTECYSKPAAGNVSENEEVIPENLTDQAEICELTLNAMDNAATKEDAYSRKENYQEPLDLKNEDSGLYINKPHITDLEKTNSVLTEMNDFKGNVSDYIKPNTDQIVDLETEGLYEFKENSSALSNVQTGMVSFDSQPHESSQSVAEQPNKVVYNRRKLGSSRRSKGRQDKEPKEEVESLKTFETKIACEELKHDLLSSDNSVFAPVDSSEVQGSMQNNYPWTDLKSLIQENRSEDQDESETGKVELSHKSEKDSLLDKSVFLENKDEPLQSKEVMDPEHSYNVVKQTEEHDNPQTDIEGSLHIDYTSQTVTHDVPKYPETVLGGMIGQAEILSNIQSKLTAKCSEGSETKQELIPAEDQENLCFANEENLEVFNQTNKDDHQYDSNETLISRPSGVNSSIGQMDKGRSLVGGTEYNPTDTKLQDSSLNTDGQSDAELSFSGNRRKLGSSRRNKGRQGVKESKPEVVEKNRSDETIRTPTMSLEKRRPEQKELIEGIEHSIIMSPSQDFSSMQSQIFSSEDQSSASKKDSDTQQQLLIVKNELFGNNDEKMSATEIEMIDKSMNVLQQTVDHSDTIHSEDTKDAGSDDALREEEKVELHPTKMQESLQTECYSEPAAGNVSENEEVIPENLTDQAEICELTLKAMDDAPKKEEPYSRKENYQEPLDVKNEDSGLYINEPYITDLEKTNSVLTEMNDFKGNVSDDIKPNTDQIVDLETEGLYEFKENSSALSNVQTGMVSFDSQPHESSQSVAEQPNKVVYNRRKLGSSRRSKGRQQDKESKEEVESLKTFETKIACEELKQDLLSPDNSVFAPVDSSEVQGSMQNNYPGTDLKSLIQENRSEDQDESETGKVELSHKSEKDSLLDKSDFLENKDETLQSKEVIDPEHSYAAKQAEEHDNPQTDIDGSLLIDYTSQTVTHDVPKYPETVLEGMIGQAEILSNIQSELTAKSTEGSETKQELLPAEDQENLCFTTVGNLEVFDQTNKDDHQYDSNETSISSPGGVNTTLGQMGESGILIEGREQNLPDTKLHNSSLSTDKQTDGDSSGRRRKLGSTRRHKGRQQGKESKEEALESTRGVKTLERPTTSFETRTVEQEVLREDAKHDIILSLSHDSSMSLSPPVLSSDDQSSSVPTNYSDKDVQHLTLKSENVGEDLVERKSDLLAEYEVKSKGLSINKSYYFYSEDPRNAVSENVVNVVQEVCSTQIQDSQETYSYKTFPGDATEHFEITSRALTVQQDVRPNTDQIFHQDKEGIFCEIEENESASSSFQSENVSLNSQPSESSENVDEQTKVDLHSRGSRRKLGSSRRNKDRGEAKGSTIETYNQPIIEVDLNASITEDVNIGPSGCITLGIQPSTTVAQEDIDTSCCTQIRDRELPKPHSRDHDEYRELGVLDGSLQESVLLPEPHACPQTTEMHAEKSSSSEHTEPESEDRDAFKKALEKETESTKKQDMFQTIKNERDGAAVNPEAYSGNMFNQTEKKAKNGDGEILQPEEHSQSEGLFEPPERTTEKRSNTYHAQVKCSVEQGALSSPQEMFSADGEENRHIISSRAAETHYFVDVVSEEQKEQIKAEQMQEMQQFSLPNDESLRQTLQSDEGATLNSLPQDSYQGLKDYGNSDFKASGNRRKLGSSRRNKERKHDQITEQNQENKALENTGEDETTQASATQQEELENIILPENLATFSSSLTEKLLEENTVCSHNVLEVSTIATSDFNPNSNQENLLKSNPESKEKDTKPIDEAGDSIQLTGYDTNKNGLMQSAQASVWRGDSDIQSILFHDGIISPRPESVLVIDQEEVLQRRNREALSCEKDPPGAEVHFQETNKEIERVGFITTEDCISKVESSMDLHDLKQAEVEGKGVYGAKQKNTSNEFVSASQEPAMDASYKGGISTTINPLDSEGEKPQTTSKQKKRKIGSSRRTPMNRRQEGERHDRDETKTSDFSAKAEMMNLGEMVEVVGEVPVNVKVLQGEDVQPQQETSLQQESPKTETSDGLQSSKMSLVVTPKQSATIDLIVETPKPDDFTSTETQINSDVAERNTNLLNQSVSSNTGTPEGSLELFFDLSQSTQVDEHSPEKIEVKQFQDVKDQMPSSMIESIHSENLGIRKANPDLTPTNRRRKMGSTRKNLGTQTKQEILEPENESTDTVTSSGDVTMASVSAKKETELQLHTEHTEDNQGKEKETVEISQFGESLLRALAEETAEENSDPQRQAAETEQQRSPSKLSSSPSNDDMSESASGGRRKKLGSNRKSGLQQRKSNQNAQNEDEAGGTIEGGAHRAAEREESTGLNKISEVDENAVIASSSRNIPEATGFSKPLRDKTSEKLFQDNFRLDQESGGQLSFGTTSGTDKSDCYNVVMIGESCVGKTSFVKRAQSGKFSLDLPASVGLDSCKWTVVVDGKPVVLQLWDTAGQERFHSITRQVFHKAQAFLLMYDITSSQSFSAVSYWANSIQEAAPEDVTVLLLGNKSEHAKRQVKTEQGDILAKEYNFEFMECSAATGENVIEALEVVARMLSQRADLLREEVTVLHKEPVQRKSSKCC